LPTVSVAGNATLITQDEMCQTAHISNDLLRIGFGLRALNLIAVRLSRRANVTFPRQCLIFKLRVRSLKAADDVEQPRHEVRSSGYSSNTKQAKQRAASLGWDTGRRGCYIRLAPIKGSCPFLSRRRTKTSRIISQCEQFWRYRVI
jgi:hypothetical protein